MRGGWARTKDAEQSLTITETQSYSGVLRDVLFAKICTLPFFEGFTARRTKQYPTQPYHLPYLGVYIMDENMEPDGEPNIGNIRFIHYLKIGISVQMEDNDPVRLELALDEAFWAIMRGCWNDQYLTNFLDTWNPHTGSGHPDNTRLEAVTRARRRHNWGPPRANNETPWGEISTEFTLRYRTMFYPRDFDTLERLYVDVVPLEHPGRVPPEEEVQRIIAKYEFTAEPARPNGDGAETPEG